MKKGYQNLKKMLSLIMVFAMLISFMPPVTAHAANHTGGRVYFETDWNTSCVQLMIGHSSYSIGYSMTKDSGNLYYVDVPQWEGAYDFAVFGTNEEWNGEGNSIDNRKGWAIKSTGVDTSGYQFNAGSKYLITSTGADNISVKVVYDVAIADAVNGTVTADKVLAGAEETVTLTVNPASGYALDALTVKNGNDNVTVTDNKFTMPAGNVTVSATFKKISYSVSFNGGDYLTSNGASAVEAGNAYTATLTAASNYVLPDAIAVTVGGTPLTASEYTYNSTTGALEIPTNKVNGDIAISANALALYTVEFKNCDVESQTVADGKTATKPSDPAKDGHTFGGWYSNEGLTDAYDFSTPVTANVTLYAKWTEVLPDTYTVTFNVDGGSAVEAQNVEKDKKVTKPADPTKTGSTFMGWYSDEKLTSEYNFDTLVTANLTLYAKWELNQYTVTFDADNNTTVSTKTVNYGSKVAKPADPTKEGYTFAGWYAGDTEYSFDTEVTGDVSLKAKWQKITYTVTFESDGGTDVDPQTVDYNGKATKPTTDPTKDGHDFAGWYSDSALTTVYDFDAVVSKSMTLYARWNVKTYTVTFETNGGGTIEAKTVEYGSAVAKPGDPTKENNLFAGWYSDESLTTAYDFDSKVKSDVTLYAKWTPLVTVYFRNDWLWTDVSVYTWTGDDSTNDKVEHTGKWHGTAMTKTEYTANGYEVYKAQIPANCNFIFNGIKNDNSGNRDQSPNLSAPVDSNIYYMFYVEGTGNTCPNEPYDPNAGDKEKTTYTAIFHFANTLNWSPVNLYVWNDDGASLGNWPGKTLSQDPATGYHTVTVTYESANNKGLNYIFNNGSSQTADLTLAADAFDATSKTAEVWVELNPNANSEGKYETAQVKTEDFGIDLAVSPQIDGDKVTFEYKAPNASSVEVRGTIPGASWDNGIAMTKNDKGIWSVTVEKLTPAVYEYKFVVNGTDWTTDPANGKLSGDNSTFTVVDPNAKDENKITINIYYERADGIYEVEQTDGAVAQWNAYVWADSMAGVRKDFTEDANGKMATSVTVVGRDTQYVALKTRLSTKEKEWIKEESEVRVDLADVVSGTFNVYIKSAGENGEAGALSYSVVSGVDIVTDNKVTDVQLDYDNNKIIVTTLNPVADPANEILLRNVVKAEGAATVTGITTNGNTYTLSLDKDLDLVTLYQYKILFGVKDSTATTEAAKYYQYDVGIGMVYASDKFAEEFTYTGDDLGATYSNSATAFKVWAPTAAAVSVNLYRSGTKGTEDLLKTVPMTRGEKGTWYVELIDDLNGTYYTYSVTRDGETIEAVDPYARTAGVNGNRGMIIDLDSTDPADGWSEITNKPASYTDAVIYELHVRDFSIDDSSGVKDEWQGKFLGLTQSGTTTSGGAATGLDYLKDLGITHLHLLPIYDYASVDETTCKTFNWGYDPQNYNVPEGSYSTNPYDGNVRVKEMKEMVDTLHENNIGVIMDVVYNHVYNAETFCFNQIVPGYFSRVNSNRSGCGNDTASEREMVRKYIVESVLYWAEEYHIDGFRFDLVGLLDVQTINEIVTEVHKVRSDIIFYGEGWDMDDTNREPGTEMAKQGNAYQTPGFGYFSDSMRNLLAGENGKSTGYVSGSTGREGEIVSNFLAKPWWTSNPAQVVQYASCHDNYTLVDKLVISTGRGGLDSTVVKMNNLAAAIYMTSQGIPFIHAGEEFLREKLDVNGNRVENSYNASDYVNHIQWSNLENATYKANSDYYKGLIAFRKAHPVLSLSSSGDVAARVINQQASDNVVSFWIDSKGVAGENVESIYVIFNANSNARTITLPAGEWNVCVDGKKAGKETQYTASGSVSVSGISAMILTQEKTVETPAAKSDYALPGSFNGWNQESYMNYGGGSTVTATLSLSAGTYTFKVKHGNDWYGNTGTIEDTTTTTSATGWVMDPNAGDCTLKATGGAYTFMFDTNTKSLVITHDPNGGTFGDPAKYYLCGYIDGEDYAMGMDTGAYAFDENGKLTTTFTRDSYVLVKNGNNSEWYWTKGWVGNVTSATLHNAVNVSDPGNNGYDKLMVPGGVEVTLTLGHNNDGTVTLTYTTKTAPAADTSGIQDGVTLHCWNWSFAEIEKNMATIAEQGYTAIQTSPVQVLKEATNLTTNSVGSHWWVYYQPVEFVITTDSGNALGTKTELASMIETAHAYGIEVIVDVVANHLGNQKGNDLSDKIPDEIRNNSAYWHNIKKNIANYSDRQQVTQFCMSGLPDLNTANGTVQNYVLNFLKECIDIGVDGFRFDAAKHIETPEDDIFYASDFWPTVVGGAESYAKTSRGIDLYVYGEVLDIIDGVSTSAYTDYMAITDNSWGNTLRNNIVSGTAALTEGYNKVADASQLVIWAESHDTYMTGDEVLSSYSVSEANINKTWALVAARADAMSLYLARPANLDQAIGVASATGWDNPEVAAVNKFHNAFAGQDESIGNEGNIAYVERGTSGVVLVNVAGGEKEISVTAKAMADGTYTDQITGNTFTVTNGKISGKIGETGIAVVYMPADYEAEVKDSASGSATVSNTKPEAGEIVTVTPAPDEGCKVSGITVKDQNGNVLPVIVNSDGTFSYVQPKGDVTIQVEFKTDYRVVEGDGGSADLDKSETLRFKVNAAFEKFVGIQIDGKDVDAANYTVSKGSTIVVLKEAYLKSLSSGDHTITFRFKDGDTAGTFKLAKASTETTAPGGSTTETTAPSDSTTETTAPSDSTTETTAPSGSTTETTAPSDSTTETTAPSGSTTETTVPGSSATETNSSETKPSTGTTPPTGDDSNIFLWSMMILFSTAAAAALISMRKRFMGEE